MKVIQAIASLKKSSGGPAFTVTSLSRELSRMGTEVTLVTQGATEYESLSDYVIPAETGVCSVSVERENGLLAELVARKFRNSVSELCIDGAGLVHVNGLWQSSMQATVLAAKASRVPIIISPHGMLEPWALQHRYWKKKVAWWLYQHRLLRVASVIHATAEQEAENLRLLGICQPIAVIPNGVDFDNVRARKESPVLGGATKSDKRTLLFLSRIHPKKGLLTLIEAWAHVRPSGWRVIIAGPDEEGHRSTLEASIASKGLVNDFDFVGSVDGAEKAALYHSADLFVLPTFSENFGVVIAEALACGLPVITTKGAPWQGLETYRCGWWIDVGVEPLVDALQRAFRTPDSELKAMGERGRIYAENEFSWPEIAGQMLAVYRWVLGQGEKPKCVVL